MPHLKSRRLKPGDTIAIVSPSWGGPSVFPHIFDRGLRNIQEIFGLQIREFPSARLDARKVYLNPQLRAEDLNQAFGDPDIDGIFTSIGGDDSVRILPYLNLDIIQKNPKILLGFSDTAAINTFLFGHGLVTYNGPSVMAGFAQMHNLPREYRDHVAHMLMSETYPNTYVPYPRWIDRYEEWSNLGNDGAIGDLYDNIEGWHWLQGTGQVTGTIFGGCIEVLEFLKGTSFWPNLDLLGRSIFFFETSEDKPSISNVKYMLRNYGSMGLFETAQAVLFGRARSYSPEDKVLLDKMIVEVISGEFGRYDMPVISNMDFGHTDPQWILPLGVKATVDCNTREFRLAERPTEN